MTTQLQEAIERLQHLPAEEQNVIAERILDEIDEWEWHQIVNSARGQAILAQIDEDARRQIAAGEVEEGGFDCA